MYVRRALFSLGVLIALEATGQNTTTGPTQAIEYVVNETSFGLLNWYSGNDGGFGPLPQIDRTLSYAGNHWMAYGGSRRYFRKVGDSSDTSCDATHIRSPFLINARSGCAPGDPECGVVAFTTWCGALEFSSGTPNRRFTVEPNYKWDATVNFDFGVVALHEMGHWIFNLGPGSDNLGHIVDNGTYDFCTLHQQNWGNFVGLCVPEIRVLGRTNAGLTGPGFLSRPLAQSNTPGSPWAWSSPASMPVTGGFGGAEVVQGLDFNTPTFEWSLNLTTKVAAPVGGAHRAQLAPNDNSWNAEVALDAIMRPTIVFDPGVGCWWMFVRTNDGSNQIRYYQSFPGLSGWMDRGYLSSNLTNFRTKYPPAAAYSSEANRIVLVWTSFEGHDTDDGKCDRNFVPSVVPTSWIPHCHNEVLAATLTPVASSGTLVMQDVRRFRKTSLGPERIGYAVLGSPSVACEGPRCEVYGVNWTQWKEITTWTFEVSTYGNIQNNYSAMTSERSSPGETDFPISVSSRKANGAGVVVEAVTGTDHQIYWRTKANLYTGFPGWTGLSGTLAVSGPSVRRRILSDYYTLFYTQE